MLTVETRDIWREPEVPPKNQGFHYNQNAEIYMLAGKAMGRGRSSCLEPNSRRSHRRSAGRCCLAVGFEDLLRFLQPTRVVLLAQGLDDRVAVAA